MCLPAAMAFLTAVDAAVGRLGVEVDRVLRIGQRLVEIGGPAERRRTRSQIASSFAALRPTRIGSGMMTLVVAELRRRPAAMMATIDRMQVLVRCPCVR